MKSAIKNFLDTVSFKFAGYRSLSVLTKKARAGLSLNIMYSGTVDKLERVAVRNIGVETTDGQKVYSGINGEGEVHLYRLNNETNLLVICQVEELGEFFKGFVGTINKETLPVGLKDIKVSQTNLPSIEYAKKHNADSRYQFTEYLFGDKYAELMGQFALDVAEAFEEIEESYDDEVSRVLAKKKATVDAYVKVLKGLDVGVDEINAAIKDMMGDDYEADQDAVEEGKTPEEAAGNAAEDSK